jgi:hypothetical protein
MIIARLPTQPPCEISSTRILTSQFTVYSQIEERQFTDIVGFFNRIRIAHTSLSFAVVSDLQACLFSKGFCDVHRALIDTL